MTKIYLIITSIALLSFSVSIYSSAANQKATAEDDLICRQTRKELLALMKKRNQLEMGLGERMLRLACSQNDHEFVTWFIKTQQACSFDFPDKDLVSVLHICCASEHEKILDLLLKSKKCTIDFKDKEGRTPLHYAAYHGYTYGVQQLLEAGANSTAVAAEGHTPIELAIRNNNPEMVGIFLDKKCNNASIGEFANIFLELSIGWPYYSKDAIDLSKNDKIQKMLRKAFPNTQLREKVKVYQNIPHRLRASFIDRLSKAKDEIEKENIRNEISQVGRNAKLVHGCTQIWEKTDREIKIDLENDLRAEAHHALNGQKRAIAKLKTNVKRNKMNARERYKKMLDLKYGVFRLRLIDQPTVIRIGDPNKKLLPSATPSPFTDQFHQKLRQLQEARKSKPKIETIELN